MPLRLIETGPQVSIYLDTHTDEVVSIAPGPGIRRVYDLDDAIEIANARSLTDRDDVEDLLIFPDEIDRIECCIECGEWEDAQGWNSGCFAEDGYVCGTDFVDHYTTCARCGKIVHDDNSESLYDGDLGVCHGCYNAYAHYCEPCETGVYDDDEAHYHDSDRSGACCEPHKPDAFSITVRDGAMPGTGDRLPRDTRMHVQLSARLTGNDEFYVAQDLIRLGVSWDVMERTLDAIGPEWKTERGTMPKRIRSYLHKHHGVTLTAEQVASLGTSISARCREVDTYVEVTRDLNESADHFYHEDSCWWGQYSESRCVMKTNYGFGMRSFETDYTYGTSGRAWVLPFSIIDGALVSVPENAQGYVVFNGYGDLAERNAAALLAHMTGWSWAQATVPSSEMYVNAGGYLVAPPALHREFSTLLEDHSLSTHR